METRRVPIQAVGELPNLTEAATVMTEKRAAREARRDEPLVPILKGDRVRTSHDPMADNAPASSQQEAAAGEAPVVDLIIRPPRLF